MECPEGYTQFGECKYHRTKKYCSDEKCPYSHQKDRKKLKKMKPNRFKGEIIKVKFVCGEYNSVFHYSKKEFSKEKVKRDFKEWKERTVDEGWYILE